MGQPDVTVSNHGSIFLFDLHTQEARDWVTEHVPAEAQFLGNALAVEHRFARDLADGMQGDGLQVQ